MFAAILLAATAATAPLPAVFGQPLGQPFAYPECPFEVARYDSSIHIYEPDRTKACFKNVAGSFEIDFPINGTPDFLASDDVLAEVIDGKVEELIATTLSYNFQDKVIDAITAKFGKPTTVFQQRVVLDAIALTGTVAIWKRDGFQAEYHSIAGNVSYGSFFVETDKAIKAKDERRAAAEAKRVAL